MDCYVTGATIKGLREGKKLTQTALAETIGVSPKTVSKWETGHGFPDVSLIAELSKLFGVDVSKLIEKLETDKFVIVPPLTVILVVPLYVALVACPRPAPARSVIVPPFTVILLVTLFLSCW